MTVAEQSPVGDPQEQLEQLRESILSEKKMCCSENWPGGQETMPVCMMHTPGWNGDAGIGRQTSEELEQPVPGVGPPHPLPAVPQVTGGMFGDCVLAVQDPPDTWSWVTETETLHGPVPVVQSDPAPQVFVPPMKPSIASHVPFQVGTTSSGPPQLMVPPQVASPTMIGSMSPECIVSAMPVIAQVAPLGGAQVQVEHIAVGTEIWLLPSYASFG